MEEEEKVTTEPCCEGGKEQQGILLVSKPTLICLDTSEPSGMLLPQGMRAAQTGLGCLKKADFKTSGTINLKACLLRLFPSHPTNIHHSASKSLTMIATPF